MNAGTIPETGRASTRIAPSGAAGRLGRFPRHDGCSPTIGREDFHVRMGEIDGDAAHVARGARAVSRVPLDMA